MFFTEHYDLFALILRAIIYSTLIGGILYMAVANLFDDREEK